MNALASLAVGLGLALVVVAILLRARERDREIATLLELPWGERDVAPAEREHASAVFAPATAMAGAALERVQLANRIGDELSRARVLLRPGELLLIAAATSIGGGLLVWFVTAQLAVAMLSVAFLGWLPWMIVKRRAAKRRKAFEAQLPEALTIVASSLEAGHTFLRSIDMMVQEADPPVSQEFERVLAETRLGDPLLDALQRMADRLQIADLAWVVQAIRIQQSVGGKLAELLMTLADFMRSREEIRREIQVLTAEGRLSANVLGGLPVFVFVVVQTLNPTYLQPMLRGWGLVALGLCALSVLIGMAVIRRMADVEV